MKKHILLIILLCSRCLWAQDNSNWLFVGPKADGASGFSPERVNCLAVDPRSGYQSNYYAGSRGGVWMSNSNGATWSPMDPGNYMYYGGSSAMAVDPSTGYVYIASTDQDLPQNTTNSICEVQNPLGTPTWSTLTALPSACLVHNLQFDPWNDYLYACTTTGLYYLSSGTWHIVYSTEVYNIAFMADGSTHYYMATGNGIFITSTTGTSTFTAASGVSPYMLLEGSGSYGTSSLANLCLGNPSTHEVWVYSANSGAEYDIYQITESSGTFSISSTSSPYFSYSDGNASDRLALGYKYFNTTNTYLFFGGISLYYINTASGAGSFSSTTFLHNDQHFIIDVPSASNIIEASDGGFSIFNYSPSYPYTIGNQPIFNYSNTGLNICQSNGFSGAGNKNFYVSGDQDALNGWTYNDASDVAQSTGGGTEPGGGIVSKLDDNTVLMNTSLYSEEYQVSSTGGASFSPSSNGPCPDYNHYYDHGYPINLVASPYTDFESNGGYFCEPSAGQHNTFFQDPSRPDYIYYGTNSLNQWDPLNQVFKIKSVPWNVYTNTVWNSYILGGAISPIYKNAFYYVMGSVYIPSEMAQAQVIKFIGPNIDDCWQGHNDDLSHWAEITPDLSTISFPFGFTALGTDGQYQYNFPAIVVSTWNPNKVWVACSPVPNNPQIKVLQYDNGTWTDYSAGIPQNEDVTSLVMEIGSNDQIYLGTNRAVYYRNATSTQWEPFDNIIPKTVVNDLEINYNENALRAGTYGRGIWKSPLECPTNSTYTLTGSTNTDFKEASQYITSTQTVTPYVTLPDGMESQVIDRAGTYVALQTGFYAEPGSNYTAFIHPCAINTTVLPNTNSFLEMASPPSKNTPTIAKENYQIGVFPNPNAGSFTLALPTPEDNDDVETSDIYVYNLLGELVYSKPQQVGQFQIDLSSRPKGIYFVKAINNKTGETDVKKVIVQ